MVVLVYSVKPRNAEVLADALTAGRIEHEIASDAEALGDRLESDGVSLGALLVTERGLTRGMRDLIVTFQDNEPIWSELPLVLLSHHDRPKAPELPLRNVILVRQPTVSRELRSVVRLALELRAHQIEVHDLLLRLEEQRDWSELALVRKQGQAGRPVSEPSTKVRKVDEIQERLASARRRLQQRREEDRLTLARELHDNIIQRLLYVGMRLAPGEALAREVGVEGLPKMVQEARRDVHTTVKELRRLIRELRPAGLELGFDAALQPMRARLAPDTQVVMETLPSAELPQDVRLCFFRVAQEALRNVERHADASLVRLAMRRRGDEVHLLVADDGRGFTIPESLEELAQDDHFGLLGVQEFVEALGGDLKIRSAKGSGTCLRARVPLGHASEVAATRDALRALDPRD